MIRSALMNGYDSLFTNIISLIFAFTLVIRHFVESLR